MHLKRNGQERLKRLVWFAGKSRTLRMTIQDQEFVEISTPTGPMRVHRFYPKDVAARPSVILYSEIYQVTEPIRRLAAQLACEGFEKPVAGFDGDARALIDWIMSRPYPWHSVGTMGFCLGGHLAFRAALDSRVAASTCFYATDLHTASLGQGKKDDTLARVKETRAEMLLIWGRQDPHVPLAGRKAIYDALTASDTLFAWHEFNGAHAFARDEGPRHDAAAARLAFSLALELFHRRLTVPRSLPA
jgi:carboxymethylenebutenolidase